jgi:hypothetical protein
MSIQSDKQKAISELAQWIKDKYPRIVSAKNIPWDDSYFQILSHAKKQYNLTDAQVREYTFSALMMAREKKTTE